MKVNGIDINGVYMNGTEMDSLYMNGNEVYTKAPPAWYDIELVVSSLVGPSGIYCNFSYDNFIKYQYNDGVLFTVGSTGSGTDLKRVYPGDIIRISFENSTFFKCSQTPIYDSATILTSKLITSFEQLFYNQTYLTQANVSNISNVKNLSYMFDRCSNISNIVLHNINPDDMRVLFNRCEKLESINMSGTTANCTFFNSTFSDCYNLKSIPKIINTSSATNIAYMFRNCHELLSIPKLDVSKVTIIVGLFLNCYKLKVIPYLNCIRANSTSKLFENCYELISILGINTSNVSQTDNMFINCNKLLSPNIAEQGIIQSKSNWVGSDIIIVPEVESELKIILNGTIEYNLTPNGTTFTSISSNGSEVLLGNTSDIIRIKMIDVNIIKFQNIGNNCIGNVYISDASKIKSNDMSSMFKLVNNMKELSIFYSDNIKNWSNLINSDQIRCIFKHISSISISSSIDIIYIFK